MHISRIDDINQFDKLKTAWDAVYSTDSHAHIFTSWAWLRGWFEITPYNWLVLAVRPDKISPYIAFFPLSYRVSLNNGIFPILEMQMCGTPLVEYSGFVCSPEYEEKAVETFAFYLQQHLEWGRFCMKDVLDPRLAPFLKCFSQKKFDIKHVNRTSCPYIPLPNTWEKYLKEYLGRKKRQNLHRSLKQIQSLYGFRVTNVQADNLENQIEILLKLRQMRWKKMSRFSIKIHRKLFRYGFNNNFLYIITLWNAETPIASRVAFLDRQKHVFISLFHCWDKKFAKLSPGNVLNAYSIRYAIENGFKVFDFTRGNEDYKFSFGAKENFITSVIITHRGLPRNPLKFYKGFPKFTKVGMILLTMNSKNATKNF